MEAIESWAFWLSPAVLGILGLLVGSFLNVVIYRKPVMMTREWYGEVGGLLQDGASWQSALGQPQPAEAARLGVEVEKQVAALPRLDLVAPRSRCGACGHAIHWYENLPVLSWLALRGRCSACGTRISMRYPFVELLTGALFAAAAARFGPHPVTLAWCAALGLLVAMAFIDLDTKFLPDELNYPLLWGGLVAAALGWTIPLPAALWGAVAGYVPLWLIAQGWALARGYEGMGLGDLKLLAALGAWLGWQAVLPIVLMASVAGLCVNVPIALLRGDGNRTRYPFGPFIAAAGLVAIFAGVEPLLERIGLGALA